MKRKGRTVPAKVLSAEVMIGFPADVTKGNLVLLVGDLEIPLLSRTARIIAGSLLRCAEQLDYEQQMIAELSSGDDPMSIEDVTVFIRGIRERVQGSSPKMHYQDLTDKPQTQSA